MPHKLLPPLLTTIALNAVLGTATLPASAEIITHWYFGANYFKTEYDIEDIDQSGAFLDGSTLTINATTEDSNGNGWKLFAGYQLNRYLAVEAGYVDLAKYTQSGIRNFDGVIFQSADGNDQVEIDIPGSIEIDLHPKGFEVTGVAISPNFYGFTVRARAGVLISDYDVKTKVVANIPAFSLGEEDFEASTQAGSQQENSTEIELVAGVGLDYRIGNDWSLGLHWDRYFDVGNDDIGEEDINVIGLDVSYHY